MDIYNEGQAAVLFDYWPDNVDWFVLGGVATSNEAQTVHAQYPDVKCVGFEPNAVMRENAAPNFPGVSYPYALWEEDTELDLCTPGDRAIGSSVCRPLDDVGKVEKVEAYKLDTLSEKLGPFTNNVLWIDIEWAELFALKGATDLLTNHTKLINLEIMNREQASEITDYLAAFNFEEVHRWGHGKWSGVDKWDLVFKKVM